MPLPSSGQISLSDVNTELGTSGQIALNDSAVRTLFAIASGQISLDDGHGKASVAASIGNATVSGTATAVYSLSSSGLAEGNDGGSYTIETWKTAGVNSAFQSRATFVSGSSLSFGNLNTWEVLSSTRTWGIVSSPGQHKTTVLTIEIRRVSDSVVLDTATITLDADNI